MVRRIPRGRVATYGQLAALLDRPRAARAVGGAMRECPADIPWHRVVNAQGGISRRGRAGSMVTQRVRLEQEGVRFRRGRVALRQHRWSTGSGAQGSVSRGRRGFDPDALLDGSTRSWRSSTPR
ncbi:MAG: methyltransferase [Candidatus Rokuibacteriota bacterium]|nr:MAG: methyltransferase [Candidatus Rokubacteria bacterium]